MLGYEHLRLGSALGYSMFSPKHFECVFCLFEVTEGLNLLLVVDDVFSFSYVLVLAASVPRTKGGMRGS